MSSSDLPCFASASRISRFAFASACSICYSRGNLHYNRSDVTCNKDMHCRKTVLCRLSTRFRMAVRRAGCRQPPASAGRFGTRMNQSGELTSGSLSTCTSPLAPACSSAALAPAFGSSSPPAAAASPAGAACSAAACCRRHGSMAAQQDLGYSNLPRESTMPGGPGARHADEQSRKVPRAPSP